MTKIQHTVTHGWQPEAMAHQKAIGAASLVCAALITRIAYTRVWRGWYVHLVLPEAIAFTVLTRAKAQIRAAEAIHEAFREELNLTPVEFGRLVSRAHRRLTDPQWRPATGVGRIFVEGDEEEGDKQRPTRTFLARKEITLHDGSRWKDVLVARGDLLSDQGTAKKVYCAPSLINLGRASVQQVRLVRWKPKGRARPVMLQLGLSMLPEFQHPNVNRPLGFVPKIGDSPLQVLVEFCDGDLTNVKLTDRELVKVLADVARGLAFLHSYGICHHDVKGSNCLVQKVRKGFVGRITDFDLMRWHPIPPAALVPEEDEESRLEYLYRSGISHQIGYNGRHRLTGDFTHMAPECWERDSQIGLKVDVWAFGILLHQFLLHWSPKDHKKPSRVYPSFVLEAFKERKTIETEEIVPQEGSAVAKALRAGVKKFGLSDSIPLERRQLIYDCLSPDPKERPTMHEVEERLSALSAWDGPSSSGS